jgi:hypothetical protein
MRSEWQRNCSVSGRKQERGQGQIPLSPLRAHPMTFTPLTGLYLIKVPPRSNGDTLVAKSLICVYLEDIYYPSRTIYI